MQGYMKQYWSPESCMAIGDDMKVAVPIEWTLRVWPMDMTYFKAFEGRLTSNASG